MKILDTKRLRVRKLTPKEYGILQAFPMDDWEQVVSDSQAYKQFGNAVTVTLFEAVATNIKAAILKTDESEELNMENQTTENKEFGMNPPTQEAEEVAVEETTPAAVEEPHIETPEEYEESHGGFVGFEEMADFITETLFNETLVPGILFEKIKGSILQTLKQEFDGKTIGEPKEEGRNWDKAREELEKALDEYASLGPAGMYGIKGLTPLKVRLDQGEKTPDLFNAIVAAVR